MENFTEIENGLFLGPQPTEQDLIAAKHRGVQTVIDMRLPGETAASNADRAMSVGLHYFSVPVDKAALSRDAIDELDRVMEISKRPALIHCATGARAALMLSLSRSRRNGWNAARTFEEARRMGFNIEESSIFAEFVESVAQ